MKAAFADQRVARAHHQGQTPIKESNEKSALHQFSGSMCRPSIPDAGAFSGTNLPFSAQVTPGEHFESRLSAMANTLDN
jgi:hypothetical protein